MLGPFRIQYTGPCNWDLSHGDSSNCDVWSVGSKLDMNQRMQPLKSPQ